MTTQRSLLITGCSSGIGLCVAHGLQQRGWRVFASARKAEDVARLQAAGLEALQLNVDDSLSIQAAVACVAARTGGRLDALFNNAGYGQPGAVEDIPREALRAQFETNLFGAWELTNAVLPLMRKQGAGRILFNSSVLGFAAMPFRGAYNASKFAMEGMADTLRLELVGTGIEVALIEPGPIISRFRANAAAQFHKYITATSSVHHQAYAAMQARLEKVGPAAPFTLPPEAVLQAVIHALESRRPHARYRVTTPTTLFAVAKRLLSTRLLDKLLLLSVRDERQR